MEINTVDTKVQTVSNNIASGASSSKGGDAFLSMLQQFNSTVFSANSGSLVNSMTGDNDFVATVVRNGRNAENSPDRKEARELDRFADTKYNEDRDYYARKDYEVKNNNSENYNNDKYNKDDNSHIEAKNADSNANIAHEKSNPDKNADKDKADNNQLGEGKAEASKSSDDAKANATVNSDAKASAQGNNGANANTATSSYSDDAMNAIISAALQGKAGAGKAGASQSQINNAAVSSQQKGMTDEGAGKANQELNQLINNNQNIGLKGDGSKGDAYDSANNNASAKGNNHVSALAKQQAADIAAKLSSDSKLSVNVSVSRENPLINNSTSNLSPLAALAGKEGNVQAQMQINTAGAMSTAEGLNAGAEIKLQTQMQQNSGQDANFSGGNNSNASSNQNNNLNANMHNNILMQQQGQGAQTSFSGMVKGAEVSANTTSSDGGSQLAAASTNAGAKGNVAASQSSSNSTNVFHLNAGNEMQNAKGASFASQVKGSAHTAENSTTQHTNLVDQVKVDIHKAALNGNDKIKVQLNPKHLGHIEIKMEVGADGKIHATLTASRPETLDMLQKDASQLEKAFQDAGLKADSESFSFNHKGESGEQQKAENSSDDSNKNSSFLNNQKEEELLSAEEIETEFFDNGEGAEGDGRLNIRV